MFRLLRLASRRSSETSPPMDSGRVVSSPNGIAWTIRDAGLTRNFTDLAVKGGQLVGLFEGNIARAKELMKEAGGSGADPRPSMPFKRTAPAAAFSGRTAVQSPMSGGAA